mmetsp:Transcript_43301/g.65441  ORF Transcript_43301/g.65441 Transcript_43301/m.65441 type:complete len:162 (+) Transcript_43301:329-814(+)
MAEYTGKCFCGAVTFEVSGDPMFNALCHCKACTTVGSTTTPMHICAFPDGSYKFTSGEDKLTTYEGNGNMRIARCTECGTAVYQLPEGNPFKAFFPRLFDGYVDGTSNKLPDALKPKAHLNYENRAWDWNDDIPKFKSFPPNDMLNNDGSPCIPCPPADDK